jgi:hypothetical protein
MIKYTTVCIDKYGRVYDLSVEYPKGEMSKKGKKSWEKNIVVDAFTCTVEECARLKAKSKKTK